MAPPRPPLAAIRAAILDLDGTLLDTAPDIAAAANRMLARLGRAQIAEEGVRDFIGKGIVKLVERCLEATGGAAPGEREDALRAFEDLYLARIADRSRPYPGVLEGLHAFEGAGIGLGCVTNKAARFTEPLLVLTGLRDFFGVVVSGDTTPRKKPHPEPLLFATRALGIEPAQALFIGDSRNDVACARAAGCPVVVVPYGYREGLAVEALGADAVVASVEEAAKSITMRS
jgi:phosphoglycolate phosphatase